jgi:DNA-binding transcriptional ArsR family regulator
MTLTATFGALADPTRLAIVTRLSRGEATMGELAEPHDMSLPAITKHLRVLVDAGLVSRRKTGRTVVCTLDPGALAEAQRWLGDLRSYWNASLDRLDRLLTDPQEKP